MSKVLIALLALEIGISLSKVFIFAWESNYLEKICNCFLKQEIFTEYYLSYLLFYKINNQTNIKNYL